jgi:Gp5 N-terminal OB domain
MTVQVLGNFWTGEVRDIRDPDKAGKMKVIVHGHHNIDDTPIQDTDLPWAHCVMNNSPSVNGIGSTTHYLPGTTVVGFWLDPETKQIPIILGSLHKAGITTS